MSGKETANAFLLSDIRAPFDVPESEVILIAKQKMKHLCGSLTGLHFRLYKKSYDARRRQDIKQVCTVLVECDSPRTVDSARLAAQHARPFLHAEPTKEKGNTPMTAPPLVVGMGPAGLFAALMLAEEGYAPVIIDRGDGVEARVAAAEAFRRFGILDTESNVQFGAGGAGTFSDGKLVTRVGDPLCDYVLGRLVEFGAPEDVKVKAKPHVGTDVLRLVVKAILTRITELGGTVRYRTKLTAITEREGYVVAHTTGGDIKAGALLLAIGHSARDTFEMLMEEGLFTEPKPFSVGVRIEHLRRDIDEALYGDKAGHPALGAAEYALSDTTGPRGVYTFCMCPGGEVVTAASEEGGVVVNGMSYRARDGQNSNSAVLVTVNPADVGGTVRGAIKFQRELERRAYLAGGGEYRAPISLVCDFLGEYRGTLPARVQPTYGDGRVTTANLKGVLPSFVTDTLAAGLRSFDKKIKGFAADDAVLTGVETRTSSPLRILRDATTRVAPGHDLFYPVGEGAGYAGGITSAALDGLRSAMALMARFAPVKKN